MTTAQQLQGSKAMIEKDEVRRIGAAQAHNLQRQLERALLPAFVLAAAVRGYKSENRNDQMSEFNALAADMLASYGGVQALEIAPAGVVRQVYPLRGNEAALGLDLMQDPCRQSGALAAIQAQGLSLVGPFELVQGGVGALGMLPIFSSDDVGERRFWGFVLVVINVTDLLEASDIRELESAGYSYELARVDAGGGSCQVFAGSSANAIKNPCPIEIEVPNAKWMLHVAPQNASRRNCMSPKPRQVSAYRDTSTRSAMSTRRTRQGDRENGESYRNIFENAVEGVYQAGLEGRLLTANPAMARLHGYDSPSEFLAANARGENHCLRPERHVEFMQLLAQRGVVEGFEFQIRRPDGSLLWVSKNARAVRDENGNVLLHQGTLTDISARKRSEELREDMADMLVHDLRTPLSALSFGLHTMRLLGDLNEAQRQCVEVSLEGGQTSLHMLDDLLDIRKMEAGALGLQWRAVSATELVQCALRQVEWLARSKGLHLESEITPELPDFCGDEERLRRTLVNLLGNAIKFTPAGGTVRISAHPAKSDRESDRERHLAIAFAVSDNGEGIPRAAFDKIFEKFGQVETRLAGRGSSSGLGLTFCKMIVEAHGGHIHVKSELGHGSTFELVLPVA